MKTSPDRPSNLLGFTSLVGLFLSSVGYARLLNTPDGRRLSDQHTWFSVVVGVLLTLTWLSLVDGKAARKASSYFVVAGLPMIIRSLLNQSDKP